MYRKNTADYYKKITQVLNS